MTIAATGAAQTGGGAAFLVQTLPLVLIFVIFYVLMIRPQQKRMKEHQATIAAVRKGDEVVTGGGIHGKVIRVDENDVDVEIASGVRVRVVKSTLSNVVTRGSKPAND
jgi:preprotein translocase subunit YajC